MSTLTAKSNSFLSDDKDSDLSGVVGEPALVLSEGVEDPSAGTNQQNSLKRMPKKYET